MFSPHVPISTTPDQFRRGGKSEVTCLPRLAWAWLRASFIIILLFKPTSISRRLASMVALLGIERRILLRGVHCSLPHTEDPSFSAPSAFPPSKLRPSPWNQFITSWNHANSFLTDLKRASIRPQSFQRGLKGLSLSAACDVAIVLYRVQLSARLPSLYSATELILRASLFNTVPSPPRCN